MSGRARLIARVAVFAALIYVFSWATSFLPNVNLAYFIAFGGGFLWGAVPGMLVGGFGILLWSTFNPYGPAALPVTMAQVVGMAVCGLLGALFRPWLPPGMASPRRFLVAVAAALAVTAVYVLPVNLVDAWLFQPFWPRFITGLAWSLPTLLSNTLIFALLLPVLHRIYEREAGKPC